ncbi:MAG: TIGR01777 family oxidoreductase [Polyangiales bacterium]
MRILVTGATGFIGRRLCEALHRRGESVVALVRDPESAQSKLYGRARLVGWNPPESGPWQEELSQVDAVVNLAGESVVGRWTDEHKKKVYDSRIVGTRALVDAIGRAPEGKGRAGARPRLLVQASAIGYYGATTAETDEASPAGKGFLAKVCTDWEHEANRAEELGTKVVVCRIGVVLGKGGGALPQMARPFKMFVGGPIGSGNQWMSWVSLDDVVGMLEMALFKPEVTGPINLVAPEPVTNRAFAKLLGSVLGRPAFMPTPEAALRAIFGEGASVLTDSQRVVPRRAIELEYPFLHPSLRGALKTGLGVED